MNAQTEQLLRGHVLDYLAKKVKNFKIDGRGGKRVFTCPKCHEHNNMDDSPSANFMEEYKVYCFAHRKCFGDIFELVKHLEPEKKKFTPDEIGKYLTELLELEVDWSSETNIKTSIQDDLNKLIRVLIEKSNRYVGSLRPNHPIKEYIQKRGFTAEVIEKFQIGYLQLQNEDIEKYRYLLQKMKLIDSNDNKLFGDNIIFPIYEYGKIKGFQLRNLGHEQGKGPKYIAYTVDGYEFYCKEINREEPIYVVEGITDHIAMWKQGFTNTVAVLTASSNKWYSLKPKKIVLVPDGDWAGSEGLEKNIRNLLRHQEVQIKVLELPKEFKDIDDFTMAGKNLLDLEEKDVVHWAIEDFEKRRVLAFEYIANRLTEIEKEQYVKFLSEKLDVSKETICKDLAVHDRNALNTANSSKTEQKEMGEIIDDWYTRTKTHTGEIIGMKSLDIFDKYFSGLQGGIYTMLAKPSHCKSLLCINTVMQALKKNDNILITYYSIDDSVDHTIAKMVSSMCEGRVTIPEVLNQSYIDNDESLTKEEKDKKKNIISEKVTWLKSKIEFYNLVWEEVGFDSVRNHMIDVAKKYPDRKLLYVFDSLHNIMGKGQRDEKFFSEIAAFLLNFSNMYDCPIICTCHTTMGVESFESMAGRTKYSGEIFYNARVEIDLNLQRTSEDEGLLTCRVVKNKITGIEGEFQLRVAPKKCFIRGEAQTPNS